MRNAWPVLILVLLTGCLPAFQAARRQAGSHPSPMPSVVTPGLDRGVIVVQFHDATQSGIAASLGQALRDSAPQFGILLATSSMLPRPGRVLSPTWCSGTARVMRARWLLTGQILGYVVETTDTASIAAEFRMHEGRTGRLLWVDHAIASGSARTPAPMIRSLVHRTWERWQAHQDLVGGLSSETRSFPSPRW